MRMNWRGRERGSIAPFVHPASCNCATDTTPCCARASALMTEKSGLSGGSPHATPLLGAGGSVFAPLGRQGQLARSAAETELQQRVLPLGPHDGLAVDALEGEAGDAAAADGVGELGE